MSNSLLKQILNEYDLKRNNAIDKANAKKEKIYKENPRLQEIDDELTSYTLSISKQILKSNNIEKKKKLKEKRETLSTEKNNILKNLNLSSSDFEPKFECKLCSDTGYITDNYRTIMCNCLKQRLFDLEYNKVNMFDLSKYNFQNFSTDIYSPIVDSQKYNSNISPRENIKIIKNICTKFIDNFDDPNGKNLLFIGNTGLGKTFLSNCIANELLKKNKTILYQTAPIMLDSIINYKMRKIF